MTTPEDEFGAVGKVRLITTDDGGEQIEFVSSWPESLWSAIGVLELGDPMVNGSWKDRTWTVYPVETGVVLEANRAMVQQEIRSDRR